MAAVPRSGGAGDDDGGGGGGGREQMAPLQKGTQTEHSYYEEYLPKQYMLS